MLGSEYHGRPYKYMYMYVVYIHVLMRDKKEESSKQGQTNNKAKQHSTPKAVTFPKKNELPRVGLEPTTLYTLDRSSALPQSYQGSLMNRLTINSV